MKEQLYCGLDLHKRFSYIVVKDSIGRQLIKGRVDNKEGDISNFFTPLTGYNIKVAIEATSNYYWMYETLDRLNMEVKLSHPLKTKAIADAKIKSDKIDANVLSDLLRADLLPASYIPTQRIRELRELLRHRVRLVSNRTQLKNRIRDILTKNNCQESFTDITGLKAKEFINRLSLSPVFMLQYKDLLEQIDFINKKIKSVDILIRGYPKEFPDVDRLTEISGIGIFSALILLAEIGDINRFDSPKKLVSYAGLCPGLHQTGETYYHKHITKEGSRYLRWILTEAAQHAVRHPGSLKDFYMALSKKAGKQKAIVAVARKMLVGIYFVLKEHKPFDPVYRKKYSYQNVNLDKPACGNWPKKEAVGTIG